MKKVLLITGLIAAGYFMFGQKKDEETTIETDSFRELTDAEAQKYINDHVDLQQNLGNDLEQAKYHWRIQGFPFERNTRVNPYLS